MSLKHGYEISHRPTRYFVISRRHTQTNADKDAVYSAKPLTGATRLGSSQPQAEGLGQINSLYTSVRAWLAEALAKAGLWQTSLLQLFFMKMPAGHDHE
jgi:hypothetical protein